MNGLTKAQFLKRLVAADKAIQREIGWNAQGGKYGAGLSNEGYAGGYQAALRDVEALLRHGHPSDSRGYWREEQK